MSAAYGDKIGTDMQDRLIGTWRLVSVTNEDAETGAVADLFGPDPIGYISYGADGRMMVVQVRSDRPKPKGDIASPQEAEALFRSMLSYAGRYTIDGDEVTHHIDVAWNETWTGTRQVRKFRLDGDLLHLVLAASPNPFDGRVGTRRVVWEKIR
jgi:lipocalin-like protein